jgi:hypothetical protein
MTFAWREQPATLLEQHFNPRVAVPDFQEALARYAARSVAARQRLPGVYEVKSAQGRCTPRPWCSSPRWL